MLLFILLSASGGCLGGSGGSNIGAPEALNASPWHVFDMQASPEGGVSSFVWTVPNDTLEYYPGNSWPSNHARFDVVPLWGTRDDVTLDSWALIFFRLGNGKAFLEGMLLEFPYKEFDYSQGSQNEARPAAEPHRFVLPEVGFKDGDSIGVVALAQTSKSVDFAVALRASGSGDEPFSVEKALQEFALRPPHRAQPRFVGQGYQYASYFFFGGMPFAWETYIGPVDVQRPSLLGSPVSAGPRLFDLSTSYESSAGWATACGILWADPGAFRWRVDSALRQATMEETRNHVGQPVIGPSNGYIFVHSGDGRGLSQVNYAVSGADAAIVAFFGLEKLDINATIQQLVGMEDEAVALIREDSVPVHDTQASSIAAPKLARNGSHLGSYTYDNCLSERPITR